MIRYGRYDPLRRGGKWDARPLSGMGIDPETALKIAEASEGAVEKFKGKSVFDVFGPTEEFQARQAIRDEYTGLASQFRRMVPTLPPDLKAIFSPYLSHINAVIVRGATVFDLPDIKGKLSELQQMMIAGAPARVQPGADFAMAGLPWYVWIIAAGLLLPKLLKK